MSVQLSKIKMTGLCSQKNDKLSFLVLTDKIGGIIANNSKIIPSFVASHADMKADSLVDMATHGWRRLLQTTGLPFNRKTKPDVDCRV